VKILLNAIIFALACGTAAAQEAQARSSPAGVVISYNLLSRHLTLHEPVIVTFNASNMTSQPFDLDLGGDLKENFLFIVTSPNGAINKFGRTLSEGSHLEGKLSLKPGANYSENLLLNERYDFPTPGQYEVQIYLVRWLRSNGPAVSYERDPRDQGFRATVQIGPRNEAILTQTCDHLVQVIGGAKSDEAREAAVALSYVADPIAVPYLEQVLSSQWRYQALIGLGRVGNDAAIQALKAATLDKGTATAAGSVLSCIQEGGQVIDAATCVGASRPPNPKAP
jgi:hypothetical protein